LCRGSRRRRGPNTSLARRSCGNASAPGQPGGTAENHDDDLFPYGLAAIGDSLYFAAFDEEHGYEPWRSDGTAAGTWLVADIAPGTSGSFPRRFTPVRDGIVFFADDGEHCMEPWRTDGTPAGTALLRDIAPGSLCGLWGDQAVDAMLDAGGRAFPGSRGGLVRRDGLL
jgi:ELWxxDGT repeat protein